MTAPRGMFEDVYLESLEGALRRKGVRAVLRDVVAAMNRVAPELDDTARWSVWKMGARVGALVAECTGPLVAGLNKRLAA